jgi:hypothetical protein
MQMHVTLMGMRRCAAAGLINWRLWVLSLCWFLVEASIYGILFWAPLLLDAIFVSTPLSSHLSATIALPWAGPCNVISFETTD